MKLPRPPNISSSSLRCLHCTYMPQRQPLPWRPLPRKWAGVKEKQYMIHSFVWANLKPPCFQKEVHFGLRDPLDWLRCLKKCYCTHLTHCIDSSVWVLMDCMTSSVLTVLLGGNFIWDKKGIIAAWPKIFIREETFAAWSKNLRHYNYFKRKKKVLGTTQYMRWKPVPCQESLT